MSASAEARAARLVLIVIALSTALRLALGYGLGLGVDEAYTVGVTAAFQWSWFDHPPLAFWMVHAMQAIGAPRAPELLLRLPFIIAFSVSIWAMFTLVRRVHGAEAGVWAAVSLCLAPFFAIAAGTWTLPDGPLILALLLAAHALVRVLFEGASGGRAWALWLAAGAALGLAGLSKYHAVLIALGLVGYVIASPHRRWLARPEPYAGAAVAAVLIAPVILWNAANGWVSFLFQGGRGAADAGLKPEQLLQMIAGEAGYLLPWTFGALIVAAVACARRVGPDRMFLAMAVPTIVLFSVVPLWGERGLPHWTMPGWLFLFPALGRLLADMAARGSPWPRRGVIASAVAIGLVAGIGGTHAATGWMKALAPGLFAQGDPTGELIGWDGLGAALAERGLIGPATVFVSPRWLEAGRIVREVGGRPVVVFDADPRGFAFLHDQRDMIGRDAVVIGTARTMAGARERYAAHFRSIEVLPPIPIRRGGREEFALIVFHARGFTTPYPWPYGRRTP